MATKAAKIKISEAKVIIVTAQKRYISKPIDWFSSLDRIKFEISFRIDNKL